MASKKANKNGSKKGAAAPAGSSAAFIKDMGKVLKKHGMKATVKLKPENDCPPNSSLRLVTRTLPNGDIVTELRCVKD